MAVKELPWARKDRPGVHSKRSRPPPQKPFQPSHIPSQSSTNLAVDEGSSSTTASSSQSILTSELRSVVCHLPECEHAFGYGSGVFVQDSTDSTEPASSSSLSSSRPSESPQIDVILSPSSLLDFHSANLSRNPDHYSTSLLPASAVTFINALGPGLWFNPYCSIVEGGKTYVVKYGVVQKDRLLEDLEQWTSFYAAGRMQKVRSGQERRRDLDSRRRLFCTKPRCYQLRYGFLRCERLLPCDSLRSSQPTLGIIEDEEVAKAQRRNLRSAVLAALVVNSGSLPAGQNEVTRPELYGWIAGLSYMGDIRVGMGFEDPQKVSKLTTSSGAPERFEDLYSPVLKDLEGQGLIGLESGGGVSFSAGLGGLKAAISLLPPALSGAGTPEAVKAGLATIVRGGSLKQTAKGLLTAGLGRGVRYGWAKFLKGRG